VQDSKVIEEHHDAEDDSKSDPDTCLRYATDLGAAMALETRFVKVGRRTRELGWENTAIICFEPPLTPSTKSVAVRIW
jgi:hypothetical protein